MNAPHEDYSHELLADLQTQSEEFIAVRRDIHQHPEMGYKEYRTSDLVAEQLEEWGYAVTRGLGGTGVVGQLKRGNGNKSIGLRADMDALPIQEATGLPYASCNVGIMHACGHDGHTAMLLAAAKHIAQNVQFCGTLNLLKKAWAVPRKCWMTACLQNSPATPCSPCTTCLVIRKASSFCEMAL